jgi:hypothetical protein
VVFASSLRDIWVIGTSSWMSARVWSIFRRNETPRTSLSFKSARNSAYSGFNWKCLIYGLTKNTSGKLCSSYPVSGSKVQWLSPAESGTSRDQHGADRYPTMGCPGSSGCFVCHGRLKQAYPRGFVGTECSGLLFCNYYH